MDRSAYARFKGDGCTVQADERALNIGIAARHAGQKLSENPFGNPDSLDMLGKPVRLLALSWRAGWCDADQDLSSGAERRLGYGSE